MEKSFGRRRPATESIVANEQQASQRQLSNPLEWLGLLARHDAGRTWARFVPFLLLDIGPHGFCFFAAAAAVILQQMNSARQQALPRRPIFRFRAPTRPFCRSNPHLFRLGGH